MRTVASTLALVVVLALGGCSPLPTRTVTIGDQPWNLYEGTGDGMRALPGFGDADGMLFDMDGEVDPGGVAFVMDGVEYPIDIAWFDAEGGLVSVASMEPCDEVPCPLYRAAGPYRWAVEAPVGAFAHLGTGDRLVVED